MRDATFRIQTFFKMKKRIGALTLALASLAIFSACKKDSNPTPEVSESFAKGADISWVTQMEHSGKKFYNAAGVETDCFKLMKDYGMNSIRLRVWVNPSNGWCNKQDLLAKATRANSLGMRLLIDIHYSDVWADPSRQTKPASWSNFSFDDLKKAVASHTLEVLTLLKDNNIPVEWVQVGNETGNGMLWEDGKASVSMANYAALNNAGYDAVKQIYPNAKVIVHLQEGNNNSLFRWLFDGLKNNGGKWDVIGMSLYPSTSDWQAMNNNCIANVKDMISRYGKEVMICEVGMPMAAAAASKLFLSDIIKQAKSIPNNKCLGIFYWEPEAYGGWQDYQLGAFDDTGKPTVALEAFK